MKRNGHLCVFDVWSVQARSARQIGKKKNKKSKIRSPPATVVVVRPRKENGARSMTGSSGLNTFPPPLSASECYTTERVDPREREREGQRHGRRALTTPIAQGRERKRHHHHHLDSTMAPPPPRRHPLI